jgi:uncharacterized membrane protein YoaK (UPF0700 family)
MAVSDLPVTSSPVPVPPSPPGPVAALPLAAVAGFVDAAGFLTLGGVFTAHMSGNSARLGVRLGQGDLGAALPLIVAIVLFALGVAGGALASELWKRRGGEDHGLAPVLAAEAALLLVFMLYGATIVGRGGAVRHHGLTGFYVLLCVLVLSMGLQTASVQRAGARRLRTTYITGILSDFAQQGVGLAFGHGEPRQVRLLGGIVVLYLSGATLGAFLQIRWHTWCVSLPFAVLLLMTGWALLRPGRLADSSAG